MRDRQRETETDRERKREREREREREKEIGRHGLARLSAPAVVLPRSAWGLSSAV